VISNAGRRDSGRALVETFVPAYLSGLLLAWDDEHQRPARRGPSRSKPGL